MAGELSEREIVAISPVIKAAASALRNTLPPGKHVRGWSASFIQAFNKEYGCKVSDAVVRGDTYACRMITFDSEQTYTWFLLKWGEFLL